MANTTNYGLYKPSRTDNQDVHDTLSNNFDKIDEVLGDTATQLAQNATKTDWVDDRLFPNLQTAINFACENKKELYIHLKHGITETLTVPEKLVIRFFEGANIKAMYALETFIRANKKLIIYGGVLDGNSIVTNILETDTELPELHGTVLQNAKGDALVTHLSNSEGEFKAVGAEAHYTRRGFMVYGNRESSTVHFENCKTTNIENQPYYFERHNIVNVKGGEFKDSPNGGVNTGYNCNIVFVDGGLYQNLYRGATFGMGVKQGYVKSTVAIDCSYAGVSIDTKLGDGSVPESDIEVTGNIGIRCNMAIRIQGTGVNVHNNTSKDHTGTSAPFYFNEAESIVGDNISTGGNGRTYMFNNSTIWLRKKEGEHNNAFQNTDSTVIDKHVEVFTASGNLKSNTDIAILDTSSGGFTVRLPRYYQAVGREIKFIKRSGDTNLAQISTLDGVLINGVSSYNLPNQWDGVTIFWDGTAWVAV